MARSSRPPRAGPLRRAVVLDRDGTLVEEVPYLHDPAEVALLPGAAGYALVVAINQAGVARGYFDEGGGGAGLPAPARRWPLARPRCS